MRLASQHPGQLTGRAALRPDGEHGLIGTFRTNGIDATILDGRFPTAPTSTMKTLPKHTLGNVDGVVRIPRRAETDEADSDRFAAAHLRAPVG